jgi:glycosyltransferase involved in cell wall biosynthesis
MIALNRAWIIDLALKSLLSQDYPKSRVFFVLVDGGSRDETTRVAESALRESGLEYRIIVEDSNIGEARNICIREMRGDLLVFWDSDVIAPPHALRELVETALGLGVDIVAAKRVYAAFSTASEAREYAERVLAEYSASGDPGSLLSSERVVERIEFAGMDLTAIRREVVEELEFKSMPYAEDAEFSLRALGRGYRVALLSSLLVHDIKALREEYSDPLLYAPLVDLWRHLNTLARLETLRRGYEGRYLREVCSLRDIGKFYSENTKYTTGTLLLVLLVLAVVGLLQGTPLLAVPLLAAWTAQLAYYSKSLGLKCGFRKATRQITILAPLTLLVHLHLLVNCHNCRKKKKQSTQQKPQSQIHNSE